MSKQWINYLSYLYQIIALSSIHAGSLYVANAGASTVSVYDTDTYELITTITVGNSPHYMVLSPDGSTLFAADNGGSTVSVIDTASNTLTHTINVASQPFTIAISPDGQLVYTIGQTTNDLSIIDATSYTVSDTISLGGAGATGYIAFTPDGSKAFVTNGSNTLYVIDTATNATLQTVSLTLPGPVLITPDGSEAYVTGNNVTIIDTSTYDILATPTPGSLPLY